MFSLGMDNWKQRDCLVVIRLSMLPEVLLWWLNPFLDNLSSSTVELWFWTSVHDGENWPLVGKTNL